MFNILKKLTRTRRIKIINVNKDYLKYYSQDGKKKASRACMSGLDIIKILVAR